MSLPKGLFLDKTAPPTAAALQQQLQEQQRHWDAILAHIESNYTHVTSDWKYYGKPFGWSLVISSKRKKLVFLTPAAPCFTASFIFNDKARVLAAGEGFTARVMQLIASGKDNPAGHSFDLPVAGPEDLEIVYKLLRIKSMT